VSVTYDEFAFGFSWFRGADADLGRARPATDSPRHELRLCTRGRLAGAHPLLRLPAPGALRGYEPEHLLAGHGRGVHGLAAAEALARAYSRARKDLLPLAGRVPAMLSAAVATRRPR
jgi:hypothetical protein